MGKRSAQRREADRTFEEIRQAIAKLSDTELCETLRDIPHRKWIEIEKDTHMAIGIIAHRAAQRLTELTQPTQETEVRCSCKDFPGADQFCTAEVHGATATPALCPHGMPLADNVCGPCSEGRPNKTAEAPTWRCSICNLVNPDDATYCRQCEYSRTVMRDGKRVPRDGQR